ncbi:MAG: phosphoribosylglycinamide formyltransferase [Acidimicrobiia bacterium]|jgi:phosphoribosylglycinamide formyltransferase-1
MSGRPRTPIAVLVSGSGSNLQSILDASTGAGYPAEVVVVISDRPGVRGLQRAAAAGVPSSVVAWSDYPDRDAFTVAVCDEAAGFGAEALILAGFMRILAPSALDRFPGRVVNIHPALLPSFPGAHGVAEAIAYGVKVSGVTVHFVDAEVDHGPIILQESVPVRPDDTEETLRARIQQVEHRVYPEVVAAFAAGRLRIEGRHVHWEGT